METLIGPALNFSILCGVLFYFLKKPTQTFVRNRHETLRREVDSSRGRLREGKTKLDDMTHRLKVLDVEVSSLRDQAKKEGEGVRVRVLEQAKQTASVLVSDARDSAESLFTTLKDELRFELGNRVIGQAEKQIQDALTKADHQRIRTEFSKGLTQVKTTSARAAK